MPPRPIPCLRGIHLRSSIMKLNVRSIMYPSVETGCRDAADKANFAQSKGNLSSITNDPVIPIRSDPEPHFPTQP